MGFLQLPRHVRRRFWVGKLFQASRHEEPPPPVPDQGFQDLRQLTQLVFGDDNGGPGLLKAGCVGLLMPTAELAGNEHRRSPGCGYLRDGATCPGDHDVTCCIEVVHLFFESENGPRYNGAF
jgi:hypothetical protein